MDAGKSKQFDIPDAVSTTWDVKPWHLIFGNKWHIQSSKWKVRDGATVHLTLSVEPLSVIVTQLKMLPSLMSVLLLTESSIKQSNSKPCCVCSHCSVMNCINLLLTSPLIHFTVGLYAVASFPLTFPWPFAWVFRTFAVVERPEI